MGSMYHDDVTIFTTAMNTAFLEAIEKTRPVQPAPWEAFTWVTDSGGRKESYPFKSPPPRLAEYLGSRRYANIDLTKYEIENKMYDAAFKISLRDVRDDQLKGYDKHAETMVRDCMGHPGREVLKHLAAGSSTPCFDGTNFFASSHELGAGNNLMTKTVTTAAGTAEEEDAGTYTVIALLHDAPIKPLIWQNRYTCETYGLQHTMQTPESKESEEVKYWTQCEGAPGYGFWWDAIKMTVTNMPSETGVQKILADIGTRFKTFSLEKAKESEDLQYIHEQKVLTKENCTFVVDPDIFDVFDLVLNSPTIVRSGAAVSNRYMGRGNLIASSYVIAS